MIRTSIAVRLIEDERSTDRSSMRQRPLFIYRYYSDPNDPCTCMYVYMNRRLGSIDRATSAVAIGGDEKADGYTKEWRG